VKRYERRLPLYRSAHVSIPVDALTPEQAVEAIVLVAQPTNPGILRNSSRIQPPVSP
jgi:hypothetical protein